MLTTVLMAAILEERKKSGPVQYGLESLVAASQLKINILSFFVSERKGIEPFSKTHTDHKGGMMRDLPLGYYADILLGSHSR